MSVQCLDKVALRAFATLRDSTPDREVTLEAIAAMSTRELEQRSVDVELVPRQGEVYSSVRRRRSAQVSRRSTSHSGSAQDVAWCRGQARALSRVSFVRRRRRRLRGNRRRHTRETRSEKTRLGATWRRRGECAHVGSGARQARGMGSRDARTDSARTTVLPRESAVVRDVSSDRAVPERTDLHRYANRRVLERRRTTLT